MGLMGIIDVYYDPKEWIKTSSWFIREKKRNALDMKRKLKGIERKYPKTFRRRVDWKLVGFELKIYNQDIRFHKKDLKKWIRVAKKRKLRLSRPMLSEVRKVMKLKEVV